LIRHTWDVNNKKDYPKIHIAVDIKKKRIISLKVTTEQLHDSQVLPVLIEDITIKQNKIIDTAIMDGWFL